MTLPPGFLGRPAAAAAVSGILVGTGIVATRAVIDDTSPASLALLRYLVGVCCLLPFLQVSRPIRIARCDLVPIGLLGITQFGILIALLNYGVQFISAGLAALLFATMPLLTMLLAAALRSEPLTLAKTLGVLLTILGVGFAVGGTAMDRGSMGEDAWIGALAVVASALSGAICSVLYRPYVRKYPPVQVSAIAMLASVGFLAILAAGEGFFTSAPRFTAGGWAAVLLIGVSSGAGYYLWLWALGHASPTRVTVFLALSPISAAALGALFLSEPVSTMALLGLGCVVLGLGLAHWPGRGAGMATSLPVTQTPG